MIPIIFVLFMVNRVSVLLGDEMSWLEEQEVFGCFMYVFTYTLRCCFDSEI